MWEQVNRTIVDNAREVWGSVIMGEITQKGNGGMMQLKLQWIGKKEDAWTYVSVGKYEIMKERCMGIYKEERKEFRGVNIRIKRT